MKAKKRKAGNAGRPLSALLSQTLVAFTLELDGQFERRMLEAGHAGANLSLNVWLTVMRFAGREGISVENLAARSPNAAGRTQHMLGCLERWRFVRFEPNPSSGKPMATAPHRRAGREARDGWGSSRGIRSDWIIQLTTKGAKAVEIWKPLPDEIEGGWRERFGDERIARLRGALEVIVERGGTRLPLAALLPLGLRMFKSEFNREAPTPLEQSANILRVATKEGVRECDIPYLTGTSSESGGVGWEVKRLVRIEPDPKTGKGKIVRLTLLGVKAQAAYFRLIGEIEQRWKEKFGEGKIVALRELLEELFDLRDGDRPLMAAGLVPPAGVIRAGRQAPALGRTEAASAARKRARDMAAQTEAFLSDPAERLPHYPLWDMNRGFGP